MWQNMTDGKAPINANSLHWAAVLHENLTGGLPLVPQFLYLHANNSSKV